MNCAYGESIIYNAIRDQVGGYVHMHPHEFACLSAQDPSYKDLGAGQTGLIKIRVSDLVDCNSFNAIVEHEELQKETQQVEAAPKSRRL